MTPLLPPQTLLISYLHHSTPQYNRYSRTFPCQKDVLLPSPPRVALLFPTLSRYLKTKYLSCCIYPPRYSGPSFPLWTHVLCSPVLTGDLRASVPLEETSQHDARDRHSPGAAGLDGGGPMAVRKCTCFLPPPLWLWRPGTDLTRRVR